MLSSSEYVIARSNATWQSPGTMSPMYSTRSGRRLVLGRNPGKKFLRLDSFLPQSRFSIQLQPDSRWGPGEGSGGRMAQRRGMQPDDYSNNDRLYLNASPQPTSLVLSCSVQESTLPHLPFTKKYACCLSATLLYFLQNGLPLLGFFCIITMHSYANISIHPMKGITP